MDMCLLIKGDVYWCRIRVAHLVQLKVGVSFSAKVGKFIVLGGGTKAKPKP